VIAWVPSHSRIKADAIMALILSSFLALGIILISLLNTRLDVEALLFGSILTITRSDIIQVAVITVLAALAIWFSYKELLFFTFDRTGAQAVGLPVQAIDLGVTIATTLAIVAGLKTVGVILVIAMMVGPGISAYLWVRELHTLLWLAMAIGVGASVVGIYLSYYFDLPSGAVIALTIFAVFWISFLGSPAQGNFGRWRRSRQSLPRDDAPC
jgi:manganese/iron transport system permease protein